ncbi:ribonuclease Oy-like [Rhopilema esculentum]|uniref:ribonuclease Oy-like n=1 Tax=Rhopilema esculentum TaxID=499914 RepID=UPI0031D15221
MHFLASLAFSVTFFLLVESRNLSTGEKQWDHIIFTQQWPESACEHVNASGQHSCEIPSSTNAWAVHGIWPSMGDTKGPNYCNESWSFDPSKIQGILSELKAEWPNLYTDTELYSFWEHEWVKHGTCAASLDSLRGEMKYFSTGLSLHKKYDVMGTLAKRGISPSRSKTYDLTDVVGVLQDEFGYSVCIGCVYNQDIGQMLYQMYICLDKSLSMIDCQHCSQSCRQEEKLVYHPIENNIVY